MYKLFEVIFDDDTCKIICVEDLREIFDVIDDVDKELIYKVNKKFDKIVFPIIIKERGIFSHLETQRVFADIDSFVEYLEELDADMNRVSSIISSKG